MLKDATDKAGSLLLLQTLAGDAEFDDKGSISSFRALPLRWITTQRE